MPEYSLCARAVERVSSAEPDFISAYHEWADSGTRERAHVHYWYTQEYDKVWDDYWQAYDILEERRLQLYMPHPMPWSDQMHDVREEQSRNRRETFYPMQVRFWRVCPLWVHMGREIGQANGDRLYTWRATLDNWERFVTNYNVPSFKESLSSAQRSSFKVLEDWWHAKYNFKTLTKAAQDYMYERVDTVATEPMRSLKKSPRKNFSLYHSFAFELFVSEFSPSSWEPQMSYNFLWGLQLLRWRASRYAVSQRVALSTFGCPEPPDGDYPIVTLNEGTWHDSIASRGLPHYLWDNEGLRTVRVAELDFKPEYVCISHTWGRWRLPSFVGVDGVPWPVPENSLYNAQNG
ncbi:hypothetical protein PG994_014515 [Apiospora phragmitis]|uniref:Uncharacterized protein n=1 Tax=Apiospora phragmitis TaxID=2905665 RepID=A0ABR1T6Y7_9PEZI